MIYVDSSIGLAVLFAENRQPPPEIWSLSLISSRLFEYEIMNRVNARNLGPSGVGAARILFQTVDLLDLSPAVLARALEPFPVQVRTLDALHLASIEFLRARGAEVSLATYDRRMIVAARALAIPIFDVGPSAAG